MWLVAIVLDTAELESGESCGLKIPLTKSSRNWTQNKMGTSKPMSTRMDSS